MVQDSNLRPPARQAGALPLSLSFYRLDQLNRPLSAPTIWGQSAPYSLVTSQAKCVRRGIHCQLNPVDHQLGSCNLRVTRLKLSRERVR